jgi:hypothetical protein
MTGHMAHFFWSILELIQNLKAFGESSQTWKQPKSEE